MKSKQDKTELLGNEDIDYGFGGILELEFSEIYDGDNEVHAVVVEDTVTMLCKMS